jgi:CheY-specific phosphatase CheX
VSRAPDIVAIGDFLATIVGVLQQYGIGAGLDDSHPERSKLTDIAVVIHVRGDLSQVSWRFPVAIAKRAATAMIPDVPLDPVLLEAAAGELANVLTGRGMMTLAAHGIQIEIEPPTITSPTPGGVVGLLATDLGTIKVMFSAA